MVRLTIDNLAVEVPAGGTILQAAARLGIEIPTLCYLDGQRACTSCFVCLVKVAAPGQAGAGNRLLPACATPVEEGMAVESESEPVRQARRTALELLLSDHLGDCQGPCQGACPAGMDIPRMIRQIAAGQLPQAIATVKADIALPAVLGRICPAPCERACRRGARDQALAICLLKRYAADADLASPRPYRPRPGSRTGKSVAVIGAGPTGLAAAYYLLQQGHGCALFDQRDRPGGMLRYGVAPDRLPPPVLEAEIAAITDLGATFQLSRRVDSSPGLEDLRRDFDAVVVATGRGGLDQAAAWRLPLDKHGIQIDRRTFQTPQAGVFAGGEAVRPGRLAVRAVADGKAIACSVGQYLAGQAVTGPHHPFSVHIGHLLEGEMGKFMAEASPAGRLSPSGPDRGFSDDQARAEAARCLHCDCRKPQACKLRLYADAYGAQGRRYRWHRRVFQQDARHAEVIYEPGKCIACGLCVQIAEQAREPLGLTFIGRGFDVRVGVPFGESLADGLRKTAARSAAACPTGALVMKAAP